MVEPGKSIGKLTIGMDKSTTEKIVHEDDQLCFWLDFDIDNKVERILFASNIRDVIRVKYMDIDLFNTKAKDLIETLDQISPYDRTDDDGYSYDFPEIGLTFRRSVKRTEEDLQEDWFKEMSIENQEDDMRYLYFEAVGVFKIK